MIYNFNNMEYFKICSCSGSFKEFKNDDKQSPTEFLRALKNCINFNKFEGYNWMTDEIYNIQTTFPNDINIPEVQYCLEYLVYCQNNSSYSNCLKPSLWTFINNFLGIKCDSYYDYLLMNYLAHPLSLWLSRCVNQITFHDLFILHQTSSHCFEIKTCS